MVLAKAQSKPEDMNTTTNHPKVKVRTFLGQQLCVAGSYLTGKIELESLTDSCLGIGVIMVELFGIQELTSRDHSATSRFLHSRRLFQGPGLPPSNAVLTHPIPGEMPIPVGYWPARRGMTSFLFRLPIPISSPSSISFGGDLASIKYEVRASVGVVYMGERRIVTSSKAPDVVEVLEEDFNRKDPEGIVVGENGKIWMQGTVLGGILVAGESACLELQVKNHSSRKTTGVQISLSRHLDLPFQNQQSKLQISDTLTTVSFKSAEYIVPPGVEGLARLVFDVPKNARSVKGGQRHGDDESAGPVDALFEVRSVLAVRLGMPLGSNDIHLELPVVVLHPAAMPASMLTRPHQFPNEIPKPLPQALQKQLQQHPMPYQYYPSQAPGFPQQYYFPPPPAVAMVSAPKESLNSTSTPPLEAEEGKGQIAERVSRHLRISSQETGRGRSASPVSHRFPQITSIPDLVSENLEDETQRLPQSMVEVRPRARSVDERVAKSEIVIHSPRPQLSPRVSEANLATLKRLSITELRKDSDVHEDDPDPDVAVVSAAVDSEKHETDRLDKTLPSIPRKSDDDVDKAVALAIATFKHRAGGLDALERQLLRDVGTRKPKQEAKRDVRDILQFDLADDKETPTQSTIPLPISRVDEDIQDIPKPPARVANAQRLKKSAQGRVAAWLGEVEPADNDFSPSTLVIDRSPVVENHDQKKMDVEFKTPQSITVVEVERAEEQKCDKRSSGFLPVRPSVLSSTPREAIAIHIDQHDPTGISSNTGEELDTLPEFKLPLSKSSPVALAKYDIRSARGGRGGKVTAITSIWKSQIEKENGSAMPLPIQGTKGVPVMPVGVTKSSPIDSPPVAQLNKVTPSEKAPVAEPPPMGDLTARTAAFIKSPRSPPLLTVSFATPQLTSTASLAKTPPKVTDRPPMVPRTLDETSKPRTETITTPGNLAFGQARLRDLIQKYQNQTS